MEKTFTATHGKQSIEIRHEEGNYCNLFIELTHVSETRSEYKLSAIIHSKKSLVNFMSLCERLEDYKTFSPKKCYEGILYLERNYSIYKYKNVNWDETNDDYTITVFLKHYGKSLCLELWQNIQSTNFLQFLPLTNKKNKEF